MILFLAKGLLRDRTRSLFPMLVVTAGVMLTVVLYSYIKGSENDIVPRPPASSAATWTWSPGPTPPRRTRCPTIWRCSDLGQLLDRSARRACRDMVWTPRIRFVGLLDVPDAAGRDPRPGTGVGLAVDLLSSRQPGARDPQPRRRPGAGRLPDAPG